MNCEEYRRLLLSDPGRPDETMLAHVANCRDCASYTDRLMRFERKLATALLITINDSAPEAGQKPAAARPGVPRRTARWRYRGLAIAASALLATAAGGLLWLAPGRSLAAAVVNHMADEPEAWLRTDVGVPVPEIDDIMSAVGAHLSASAGLVSYVHRCEFRGHEVPHLVVQTASGPVTVMVLVHESPGRSARFDTAGYRGVIVPLPGHGSLAVLEQTVDADAKAIDAVVAQVSGALTWTH